METAHPQLRALVNTIYEVTQRLREGRFPNEKAVSQGIVLRLLQELGWDVYDPTVVWPEYQTGGGRADFALCNPATKPCVFIEVKQPGKAEEGVRQSLEYAFHTGVPFIVLTDGCTWSFYLPAEQGSYEDRRVYKLDLFERPSDEAAKILHRYLLRDRVTTGEALEDARKEYRNRNRRLQAKNAIPDVWRELVEKGNEDLVELLASAVEVKVGVRPDDDDVADFLAGLGRPIVIENARPVPGPERRADAASEVVSARAGQLILRSRAFPFRNAKEAMLIVLRELAKDDPNFLLRLSQHPDIHGRKRRYVARRPEELYPDREDLRELCEPLPGGWFVSTNLNNVQKMTIIKAAAEVAGLTFGKDIIVKF
ncbi:MAG: type I restriction enzyme HsdR N-terminal domain-containing protein [Verrucomicrobiae bacterium]|nr:type I restriction enzyme HsdR N-terminal domain-containing protein [Verrucomicrobiae bacterium]